jgi:hypothetical protein
VWGAVIAIEIAVADASSPYAPALVRACNQAMEALARCTLATENESTSPAAVAVVSWRDADHLAVEIEVGVRHASRSDWFTRKLVFHASDAEVERWRAVGLVIATMVGERDATLRPAERQAAAEPVIEQRSGAETDQQRHEAEVPAYRGPRPWELGAGLQLGRGSGRAFGAGGGFLSVSRRVGPSFLHVVASLDYLMDPHPADGVRLEEAGLAAGLGAQLIALPRLVVDFRLEPGLRWVGATLPERNRSDGGFLFDLREGVDTTYWWTDRFGIALTGSLAESSRRTSIRVSGEGGTPTLVAERPPIGWTAGLGIRLGIE